MLAVMHGVVWLICYRETVKNLLRNGPRERERERNMDVLLGVASITALNLWLLTAVDFIKLCCFKTLLFCCHCSLKVTHRYTRNGNGRP